MRAARQIVIPLWADHIGLSPAASSVIFGVSSAVDMLVFYPAGKIMDQWGRLWVALPCTIIMGISLALMPLTTAAASFVLVAMLMGLGNGFGSGINMTLGADASPDHGRTEFLGLWRLISDVGTSAGPFVLSGVTALVSLGAGIGVTGAFGFISAAIFWRSLGSKAETGTFERYAGRACRPRAGPASGGFFSLWPGQPAAQYPWRIA
jgi:MFS family permease